MSADLQKNLFSRLFTVLRIFAAKWVTYYILGVLRSYYDDFLSLKMLLKNNKKN